MAIGVSRLTLPSEFYDLTSAQLLVQPEPQYAHGRMAMAAMNMDLMAPDELGLPGRGVGGQGAPYGSATDDRLELAGAIPEAVFAVKHDFKGGPGHTLRLNRPAYTDSTYTQSSRIIPTGTSISTTPIAVTAEQVELTLKRFGGPYDGSAVAPYAIEAFDAQMGVHNLAKVVGRHLRRDFHKTLDAFFVLLADAGVAAVGSTAVTYKAGVSADNDMTTAGSHPLDYEMISRCSQQMDEANLPVLPDGRRCLFVTPRGKKQVKDDAQYARYAEYHKEMNVLFPSYFGSLPEFHLFVSNTLTKTANGSSIDVHKAQAIAPGLFGVGVGRPPRVASSTNDNYGEQALVLWLADLALETCDNRFVRHIRYT